MEPLWAITLAAWNAFQTSWILPLPLSSETETTSEMLDVLTRLIAWGHFIAVSCEYYKFYTSQL
jgi:hypothetical protein